MTRAPRMSADERREATVLAATRVFGRRGYHGATTDEIAREAGISQPYVVRMFGSKQQLFLAVTQQALELTLAAFRHVVEDSREESRAVVVVRLGEAYRALAARREIHLVQMHAYALGADPVIGPAARAGFRQLVQFLLDEAGLPPAQTDDFMARGMLVNTVLGLRMAEDPTPVSRQLVDRVLPEAPAAAGATERGQRGAAG
ncbi:TetR/AcrR family transcriptional regulator [Phycicoccus endophyticus]|uniref:TetR/AcrR family transcriptional regulator n=1 Tax=Phycicoccus endophyticus TaxID=1690220 RepID=A0A7G9QZX3_9MICO|nr:TetR/AcrR family transcriptional regulator [Phycicoccus endophyticus]NHI20752.1 TetR/AcrR family transcriptional regulator [Phycicoccus endophyticus]QNN48898.1 TetR/AcrR family transcriptional regulator [Phycicoccus endophyticus]GGL43649.1 TetR family transcriptional regulator [Phycicoccus endophyticus]